MTSWLSSKPKYTKLQEPKKPPPAGFKPVPKEKPKPYPTQPPSHSVPHHPYPGMSHGSNIPSTRPPVYSPNMMSGSNMNMNPKSSKGLGLAGAAGAGLLGGALGGAAMGAAMGSMARPRIYTNGDGYYPNGYPNGYPNSYPGGYPNNYPGGYPSGYPYQSGNTYPASNQYYPYNLQPISGEPFVESVTSTIIQNETQSQSTLVRESNATSQPETAELVSQDLVMLKKAAVESYPEGLASFTDFSNKRSFGDLYFVAIVVGASVLAISTVIGTGYCFYRFQQYNKSAGDVDYPAYGVVGPQIKDPSGTGSVSPDGDRKLAQSAQMYHYHHQKQQMIASEKVATSRHTSASDVDSEEENEEGDYTVYECPGLASTGEMEVKNPLFHDDITPDASPCVVKEREKNEKEESKDRDFLGIKKDKK